ncbi:hypothetical protein OX284_007280 [Flavobacterium sp. SUN046]|uniref:hypothetical protein n=1 Tax=Flavobacterium sp. SUN046 TaxID=3002440 RepID=UPI002DBB67EB|nr:hypothetical protein [Flavobacterium sp. SUN046]MEC4049227.1 hypothetical protein [Flavobacterium sp. SUN046]
MQYYNDEIRISDFEMIELLKKFFKILVLTVTLLLTFSYIVMLSDSITNPDYVGLTLKGYIIGGVFLVGLIYLNIKYVIKYVKK